MREEQKPTCAELLASWRRIHQARLALREGCVDDLLIEYAHVAAFDREYRPHAQDRLAAVKNLQRESSAAVLRRMAKMGTLR